MAPPCWAGPDPVAVNGAVATAQGDQSAGVRSGVHFAVPPVTDLRVSALTEMIDPAAGLHGVQMYHLAGDGDDGIGFAGGGFNGDAGGGGLGLILSVDGSQGIITHGQGACGLEMQSLGGGGGDGGWAFGVPIPPIFIITSPAFGGNGASGGSGGALSLNNASGITTYGDDASAIFARSDAGDGGDGGWAFSTTYAEGGNGGVGGAGGAITLVNTGALQTIGAAAGGIVAESFGGEGGNGGEGDGTFGNGGAGLGSGPGGAVTVTNSGGIITGGLGSKGILATSVGGFAGAGGAGGGLFAWGGSGASSGVGGAVDVTNSGAIVTAGAHADAVFAQSVGGGGGSGGGSGGLFTFGGSGQAGGDGGAVTVTLNAALHTTGSDASGIFAQSLGGGGGDGGGAVSAGALFTAALGGSGGPGGDGVALTLQAGPESSVRTEGDRSYGIHAQSLGGGGGAGGYAVSMAVGEMVSASIAIGGRGSQGGDGGIVTVTSNGVITTLGQMSHGLYVQSTGGGGGSGGFAISAAASGLFSGSFALGGTAGGGGNASGLTVTSTGTISTLGSDAEGILVESVGGGGGGGGWAITGAGGGTGALALAIGGGGGDGGNGGQVSLVSDSAVTTQGLRSFGIHASSTGGGGGSGGLAISGAGAGGGAITFNLGGSGGGGGDAQWVNVTSTGSIVTSGDEAVGLLAESTGGGGGNGALSITGAGAGWGSLSVGIGGSGGDGGFGRDVTVNSSSSITTSGSAAHALSASSTGGGGGSGGFSIVGSGAGSFAGSFSLGGSGGLGGDGATVTVTSGGYLQTQGVGAVGLMAQSVGGGGGRGGWSLAGAGAGTGAFTIGIGGSGGDGGAGGVVTVNASSAIDTLGAQSHGIHAHSTGGGGGIGGFSLSGSGAGAYSGTFNLGGSGGGGGDGKNVTVTSSGTINTQGASAVGIIAESVGGGGGRGGWSLTGAGAGTGALAIGVGGSGGDGGDGGEVTVTSASAISTLGDQAFGIHAHSTGGGGGIGGFSLSGAGAGSYSGTFSLGGSGGDGGAGKAVAVAATGSVITAGDLAVGIMAESVGGGGGHGGWSITGAGAGTSALAIGIGGFGGDGGDAAGVTVTAGADITTQGSEAHGIHAISTGGGGGVGRFSISGAGGGDYSGTFSLGGSGGGGGNGQNVAVTASGNVQVFGDSAIGILAESVGGGGGHGGWSITGAGAGSGSLSIGVGGLGGDGGIGGDVTLNSLGAVSTHGDGGVGLHAESTGGGGGSGGFSITGDGAGSAGKVWAISVGGFGGDGNIGGTVNVLAAGSVLTTGTAAHGIVAKSGGGGGGSGGFSASIGTGFGGAQNTWNLNLATSIGGFGGDGNTGGTVGVTTTGPITTLGDDSHGIYAQSVGGGGGDGGSSFTATIGLGAANEGRSLNGGISVGGFAGSGNTGGTVTIDSSAPASDITTMGDKSDGIRAQSIGGGGGNGGTSRGISFLFKIGSATLAKDHSPGANWQFSINVGGNGGSGHDGGAVTVDHAGGIVTAGALSRGIVAQSVGAGGGSGGDGIKGTGTAADYATLALIPATEAGGSGNFALKTLMGLLRDQSLIVGGSAGGSGDGDVVTITNSGSITTYGFGSTAIFAQSIGGGGGEAQSFTSGQGQGGRAVSGMLGKFAIGGGGGAAGDGDLVTVTQTGDIYAFGDEAHGIFAQSIGGGGGVAGNIDRALVDGIGPVRNIGLGLAFARDGGGAGDGGNVTVTSTGNIVTSGAEAYGIKAQSIGGGGGAGGGTGIGLQNIITRFDGSVGGDGSGGIVNVTSTGNIITTGDMADGVFTQSAGGTDSGGAITIVIDGDVMATGTDSYGILANSRGDAGAGDITITANGSVIGGAGDGVAIQLLGGQHNAVATHGLVTTPLGCAGYAIRATDGDDTIHNRGTVRGSVDLGGGANRFNNLAGAVFEPGAVISLGAGNQLHNAGHLALGGCGPVAVTTLGSDYVQAPGGTYEADIDPATRQADLLRVDGSAQVAGTVEAHVVNAGYALPGQSQVMIIQASAGLTDNGCQALAAASAVVSCSLLQPDPDCLMICMGIDFAPVGLNENQTRIGRHVNAIQSAGSSASFAPIAEALVALPDVPALADAYDSLSPEAIGQAAHHAVAAGLTFTHAMHSVPALDGQHRFIREHDGFWSAVNAQHAQHDRTSQRLGSENDLYMLIAGFQKAFDKEEQWIGGIALSIENSTTATDPAATTEGEHLRLGAVLKRRFGATQVAVSAAIGHGWYDTRRLVDLPTPGLTAASDWALTTVSGNLRLSHDFEQADWYIRPMLDLGVAHVHRDGFTETGARGANLIVASQDQTFFYVNPAIQVGLERRLSRGTVLRPRIRAGLSYLCYDTPPQTVASFAGAPPGVGTMAVLGDRDELLGTLAAGIDLLQHNGMSLQLEYTGQFSDRTISHGGMFKLAIPF
ncbi:MAG: hypothetical protein WD042_09615 [Phycisphaeraceae bacterium]